MMRNYVILFFTVVLFFSFGCNNGNAGNSDAVKKDDSATITVEGKDSAENKRPVCTTAVKDFLKWYKKNYTRISTLQNEIVTLNGEGVNSQYRVNFKNAEKYTKELQSSGFISEKFVHDKLEYFKESDKNLLKEKQNDGPPVGFESDLILFTQEPEAIFNQIDSLKLEIVQPNVVKLISSDHDLLFSVENKNDKCVFDEISFGRK